MVDALSPYSDVMHGIELGAVDVLEKPLSSLKLRNIWQHVVRKARPCRGVSSARRLVIFAILLRIFLAVRSDYFACLVLGAVSPPLVRPAAADGAC